MARMQTDAIDLDLSIDLQRRRQMRMAEIANAAGSSLAEDESIFSKENMEKFATTKRVEVKRNERKDFQSIGSGTRCLSCGMLHFCYTPRCGMCGDAMHFNMGSHSVGRRVV